MNTSNGTSTPSNISYYPKQDLKYKLDSLLEYFKYHKDIPRLFMRKLGNIAVNYFEK